MSTKLPRQVLATHRKAFHQFSVLERLEAGIALTGTEVKSCRQGHIDFSGSFVRIRRGNAMLINVTIQPYSGGNRFNHKPDRERILLLHKAEILKIGALTEQKGLSVVPLEFYLRNGHIKVELGVCRGKKLGDKRETLKRKTQEREAGREVARARRRG